MWKSIWVHLYRITLLTIKCQITTKFTNQLKLARAFVRPGKQQMVVYKLHKDTCDCVTSHRLLLDYTHIHRDSCVNLNLRTLQTAVIVRLLDFLHNCHCYHYAMRCEWECGKKCISFSQQQFTVHSQDTRSSTSLTHWNSD